MPSGASAISPARDTTGDAPEAAVPTDIQTLVQDRQTARRAKDFAKADSIRKQLTELGWVLEDSADGPRVRRA